MPVKEKRGKWIPVTERKKTMAEYIDKQAAIEAFDDPAVERYYGDVDPESVIRVIESIPAADVRPVVRGKWVQIGGKYSRHKTIDRRILTCSVCGNILSMEGVNAGRGDANFCPNCGAGMEES